MLKPEELKTQEFEVSVIGGYKRESVDSVFENITDCYTQLYNENSELKQKLKVCVGKIEEYRKDEQFLKTAIINAEKLNENALRDMEAREKELETSAKEKAEKIVAEAQAEADNIVERARKESEDAIKAYEDEARSAKEALDREISVEQQKLDTLKKESAEFKENLFKLYKNHLDLIMKLPSAEKKEPQLVPAEKTEKNTPVEPEKADKTQEDRQETKDEKEATAEFVIESKSKNKDEDKLSEVLGRELKYKDLKFGTDFDLKAEE